MDPENLPNNDQVGFTVCSLFRLRCFSQTVITPTPAATGSAGSATDIAEQLRRTWFHYKMLKFDLSGFI